SLHDALPIYPDPMAEGGRVGHRRDPTITETGDSVRGAKNRTSIESLATVLREDTDKPGAIFTRELGALAERAADEGFLWRGQFAQAGIVDRHAAVELGAGHMTLFNTERAQCLNTVEAATELLRHRPEQVHHCLAMIGGDIKFIG